MRSVFVIIDLLPAIEAARGFSGMPEASPAGWSIHPVDPAEIVRLFPPMQVDEAYRLVAYQ